MRFRTPLAALVAAVALTAAAWPSAVATATAQPMTVVDACPRVAPPKATCFAKVVKGAPVGTLAAPAGFAPADLVSAYGTPAGGSGQVVGIVDAFGNPRLE